jgi:hypothetical protein
MKDEELLRIAKRIRELKSIEDNTRIERYQLEKEAGL